jgi:hypothetical protein
MVRAGIVLLVVAGTAHAEPERRSAPHPPSGLGGDLVFGWAGQLDGPDGFVARYENELLPVLSPSRRVGGVFGFYIGGEYWRSQTDHAGFSLPVAIVGGIRVFPVRAVIGVGADAFLIDQVADDTGVGFWAPLAMARLGADVFGFQVGADARVGRRWQFGAPDHTRWQLGIFIGRTWESRATIY